MATRARYLEAASRAAFSLTALALTALAGVLIVYGLWQVVAAIVRSDSQFGAVLLQSVGFVVVAIATFEVAKYLMEEEVLRGREMRNVAEARRSLTKFVSTIIIAVLLEGLVTVFRISHGDVSQLVYPALLLGVGIAMLVGLGLFQRWTAQVQDMLEKGDIQDR